MPCSVAAYDIVSDTYSLTVTNTATGFYPALYANGLSGNDYAIGGVDGLAFYNGGVRSRPVPNPSLVYDGGTWGGWTFRNYGAAVAGMPTGFADGGAVIGGSFKLQIFVVGPGTMTLWSTSVGSAYANVVRVDQSPGFPVTPDAHVVIDTVNLTYPSTQITIPDDGACLHFVSVVDQSNLMASWFYGGFDWLAYAAAFSGTPLAGGAPLNVDFTDASGMAPTSWAWNFGDGGTSTSQNPSHIYVANGAYTVTLTATNAGGSFVETKVGYVVVSSVAGSAPRGISGAPEYVIEIYNSGATFGPNTKLAEIWDARNVGWSRYDRLSGKAFFTLSQTSAVLPFMDELTTHIAIWRITPSRDDLVYRGAFIDRNATGDDVILDCFDYLSLLSLSRSGFKTLYPTKLLGTEIVSPEWLLTKNATSSPLGFVTTGVIENPLGTDGVTAIKTNAQFGTLDQFRLQLFFDLSEMGRANTTNHVTYEIDLNNTFHFYKNRGSAASVAFILGGNISDYQWLPAWSRYRNDIATIGVGGTGGAAEIVATNAAEITAKGRRQDVTTLKTLAGISGGGTEADQQKAALERELKKLVQQTSGLSLRVARGRVEPFVGWSMNDTATIEISNGDDLITGSRRIVGVRCLYTEAGEDIDIVVNSIAS